MLNDVKPPRIHDVQLDDNELSIILDALAGMPLARAYNLFNKMHAVFNAPQMPPPQMGGTDPQ